MKRHSKSGIFNNAVFSKIVVRASEHPDVQKGVAKDLRFITKKPEKNHSCSWNHAHADEGLRSAVEYEPVNIRNPGRGLKFLKKSNLQVRAFHDDEDAARQKGHADGSAERNIFSNTVESLNVVELPASPRPRGPPSGRNPNPTVGKQPSAQAPRSQSPEVIFVREVGPSHAPPLRPVRSARRPSLFSDDFPVDEIVERTNAALPKLTLRNETSTTYSQLVLDLCRKAVTDRESTVERTLLKPLSFLDQTVRRADLTAAQHGSLNSSLATSRTFETGDASVYEVRSPHPTHSNFEFNVRDSPSLNASAEVDGTPPFMLSDNGFNFGQDFFVPSPTNGCFAQPSSYKDDYPHQDTSRSGFSQSSVGLVPPSVAISGFPQQSHDDFNFIDESFNFFQTRR